MVIQFLRNRDIKKQIWLNEEENNKLKTNAKKCGLTESSYLRMLIMGYKPKEQPNEIIYEMLNQLRGIGNNFNQIARKANSLDVIDAPYYKSNYERFMVFQEKIKKELFDIK